MITEEVWAKMKQWKELDESANKLKLIIDNFYPQKKPLLKYLDNEVLH
jgi:hypothetical protein